MHVTTSKKASGTGRRMEERRERRGKVREERMQHLPLGGRGRGRERGRGEVAVSVCSLHLLNLVAKMLQTFCPVSSPTPLWLFIFPSSFNGSWGWRRQG